MKGVNLHQRTRVSRYWAKALRKREPVYLRLRKLRKATG